MVSVFLYNNTVFYWRDLVMCLKIGPYFIYFIYSCLDKWTLGLDSSDKGNELPKFSLQCQQMEAPE